MEFSLEWLKNNIDFPALVFIVLLSMGIWVLYKAQTAPDNGFDVKQMLLDDRNKPSAARLGVFVSLAATTWALMYHVIYSKGQVNQWILLGYAGIWSGSAVATKFVEAWAASKGVRTDDSAPPSPGPTSP